jgi:signal transduction histidine kinase
VHGRGGVAEVTVTDHGEGMPPDVVAHVFDRFYRADPSRTGAAGNSGLGLAIASWALREMGGDVRVESEVGAGTRVTLVVPASHS